MRDEYPDPLSHYGCYGPKCKSCVVNMECNYLSPGNCGDYQLRSGDDERCRHAADDNYCRLGHWCYQTCKPNYYTSDIYECEGEE